MSVDPKEKEIQSLALQMVETSSEIAVTDQASLAIADEHTRNIREAIKRVKEYFDPICESANKTHKMLTKRRRDVLEPLEKILKTLDGKIAEYARKEEERRRVEQEKARREAQRIEEDRRIALAEEAEAAGDKELANEILDRTQTMYGVGPPPIKTEVKGLFDHWSVEAIDLPVLVKAWFDGTAPKDAIVANEKFIGQEIRTHKENFSMPGVTARCEKRRKGTG